MNTISKNDAKCRYWLYAPEERASMWEQFYKEKVMGIGWDYLGDLATYTSKEKINEECSKN